MKNISRFLLVIAFQFCLSPAFAADESALRAKLPEDRVLGKASAKVTIIEYASLSCPHCAEFHTTILPVLQKEYIDTGKVKMIFRDFPLNEPAFLAAKVTHCAAQKGDDKYYAMLKTLFEKQKEWAFEKEFLPKLVEIAKGAGMEESAVGACLADKELEAKILNTRKDAGEMLKINSTPSFLINGDLAENVHSVEEFRKALDSVLSGKSLAQQAKEAAQKITVARPDDVVLGKEKAKVTVVEYSNIACPHCGQFHMALVSALQKDYIDAGKVKLVFRELPLNQSAFYAYMLAHCKGKGEFFNILSMLIGETRNWAATPAFLGPLREVAEKAGISRDAFYACMENKETEKQITSHAREAGEKLGINRSPVVYINGEKIEEPESPEVIREAVERALKSKK